jgi:hypothetical protein
VTHACVAGLERAALVEGAVHALRRIIAEAVARFGAAACDRESDRSEDTTGDHAADESIHRFTPLETAAAIALQRAREE